MSCARATGMGHEGQHLKIRVKWTFDLWEGNAGWLQEAGLQRENIIISRLCTICRQDLFFSYRGSGGTTGRMAALLMLC